MGIFIDKEKFTLNERDSLIRVLEEVKSQKKKLTKD